MARSWEITAGSREMCTDHSGAEVTREAGVLAHEIGEDVVHADGAADCEHDLMSAPVEQQHVGRAVPGRRGRYIASEMHARGRGSTWRAIRRMAGDGR